MPQHLTDSEKLALIQQIAKDAEALHNHELTLPEHRRMGITDIQSHAFQNVVEVLQDRKFE